MQVLATACALLGLGLAAAAQERVPDLRLPTIDGDRTLSLRDLAGKKLLLIEFASW